MYILSYHTPLADQGIWWSLAIANLITLVITIVWYMKGGWRHKKLLEHVKLERRISEEMQIDEGVAS
jgi:Na+-driven multidrug efflux pump